MGLNNEHDAERLRATAVRIATSAAELARTMRAEAVVDGAISTKSTDTDVVTAADQAAERFVRKELARLRPDEPVYGEEEGGESSTAGLRWVVDPIDGTVNYLYGFPWYGVSLAAQVDGESVAGVVVEPASGRVWSAARGHGATLNDEPLRVSAARRLDLALVGTGFAYDVARRQQQAAVVAELIGDVRDIRRAGAASLDLCAVAAGWLDGYYEHGLSRWDWAAGALIATEAGADLRLPGAEAADGLGEAAILCTAPGITAELTGALHRAGVARLAE